MSKINAQDIKISCPITHFDLTDASNQYLHQELCAIAKMSFLNGPLKCFRWWFAGGLYFIKLDKKDSLQLTATYGFVLSATVILLGPLVGNWIDKTRHIKF